MSNARNAAVALYTLALANAATADWQAVATSFFEALPKGKAAAPGEAPAWFADYAIPKAYTLESMEVQFTDGHTLRTSVVLAKGKPARVGAACRAAIGFYRARHGQAVAVPAFASLRMVDTGTAYDAAECSRLTDSLRAIPGTVQGRPMTAARIDWMARELARREAGLAPHAADLDGANASPWVASLPQHMRIALLDPMETEAAAWRRSVAAAEGELAMMREAYVLQRGEAAPVAVAVIAPVVAPVASPVALPADPEALRAAWCEAVSGSHGEPGAYAIANTGESGADGALEPREDDASNGPAPRQDAPQPGSDRPDDAARTVSSVEGPDSWMPTEATHPVIAYCLSEKAWHALRDRVQDGTFPAPAGAAKFGAWRLTLADAQDLQDVGSIRFAGMPRKPYTRRAVAPVSAFVRIHAGAAFMASNPPSPATLHAASV